jgi:predicted homoserine dehydrogenase-like protein
VTDNATLLCEADGIDCILEVTGAIEFGAQAAMAAIEHGKHFVR